LRPLQQFGAAGDYTNTAGGAQSAEVVWHPVADLAQLQRHLREAGDAGQPVLLDLYADWCISCKVMERSVFPQRDVAAQLSQFHLVRADVTKNDADDKALLNEFGLFGPPSLVFFTLDGREITEVRIQGEVDATVLANHLAAVLDRFGVKNFGEIAANFGETALN
jgi:thiol:disulfide interchange protein DsbD